MDALIVFNVIIGLTIVVLILATTTYILKRLENKNNKINFDEYIHFSFNFVIERSSFIKFITGKMKLDGEITVLHRGDKQYQVLPLKHNQITFYLLLGIDGDCDMSICPSQIILIPPVSCNPVCDARLITSIKTGLESFLYPNIRYEIKEGRLTTKILPPYIDNVPKYEKSYSSSTISTHIILRTEPISILDVLDKAGVSVVVEDFNHAGILKDELSKGLPMGLDYVIVLRDPALARHVKSMLSALSPSTGIILVTSTVVNAI